MRKAEDTRSHFQTVGSRLFRLAAAREYGTLMMFRT